jgi:ubiquinone/menaquinone biosynthesis C-methylase UbiE
MNIKESYDIWAHQYDSNKNKTRDMESSVLRATLGFLQFDHCLEIGCGTGKNTEWLMTKAKKITAVDFSEGMLIRAKEKINSPSVDFIQADINEEWSFCTGTCDCIIFSLVLEHIANLDNILRKASTVIKPQGYVYIGELHPFKQYMGTKARFEIDGVVKIVESYTHHISDFNQSAKTQGFDLIELNEYFDENDRDTIPRIICLLFRKG